LVERAVSLGEDVEEAQEAVDEIVQYYTEALKSEKKAAQDAEEAGKKRAQEELNNLKTKVKELKEIVPGFTLTPKEKEKIIEKLTKPVKEINGVPHNAIWSKRQEDPFKFDTILAALDEIGIFDGKWDKLIKKGKSKIVEDLRKSISSNTAFKTGVGNVPNAFGEETTDALESMKASIRF
jgi:DNA repair exonuclease SbcCD ATPase subunit